MAKAIKDPYISAPKLAEYTLAKSTRRRQIIKNLKKDLHFLKLRYSGIRNMFSSYVRSNYDVAKIESAIKRVERRKGTTVWDMNDDPNTILALKSLKKIKLPDLSDYEILSDIDGDKVDSITLADVKVNIKPDVYLINKKNGKIGAIKMHCAKTPENRLNKTGLEYVATLIKAGFVDLGYDPKDIDIKACIAIDIFEEHYSIAPSAFKRTLNLLEASCEEIADRWLYL